MTPDEINELTDKVIERVYQRAYKSGWEDCQRLFGYELGYKEGLRIGNLKRKGRHPLRKRGAPRKDGTTRPPDLISIDEAIETWLQQHEK
jgi:hypothetical protein